MRRLLGLLRATVLGALIALLLAISTGVGLLLLSPAPDRVAPAAYWLTAIVLFTLLVSAAFGTLLSARVLAGCRPLQLAPSERAATIRQAAAAAGLRAPTCWTSDQGLDAPLVLQGLRQSHVLLPAVPSEVDPALAERVTGELAGGAARVTLFGCTVLLALQFWINLAGYLAAPWSRRSALPLSGRVPLFFLPLLAILLLPLIALNYLTGLITQLLIGPARARTLVRAFGTGGGRPRIELRSAPSRRYADWFPAAAIRSPEQVSAISAEPAQPPRSAWIRPGELGAGMSGVATVYLVGVLLLAPLVAHWPAMAVGQRWLSGSERAVSAPVVSTVYQGHRGALIADLSGTWTPTVRLPDGRLDQLPASTNRPGPSLPLAIDPAGRIRNREQDSLGWLTAGTLFTGVLLLGVGWGAARTRTSPSVIAACARIQASGTGTVGDPPASRTERLAYRARTLAPVLLVGLLVSGAASVAVCAPLGGVIAGQGGRRVGFLVGTAVLFAGVVYLCYRSMVVNWTDQDYRRWLVTRFGSADADAGFSAEPVHRTR